MTLSLNGAPVKEGTLYTTRVGFWVATVELTFDTVAPTGVVRLSLDGELDFVGTVIDARTVNDNDAVRVRIQAGNGNWDNQYPARHWQEVTALQVIEDTLSEAGETLSADSDIDILRTRLTHWSRPKCILNDAIQAIADHLSLSWRTLPDGTLWVGEETWPEATLEIAENFRTPGENSLTFQPIDEPTLLPGSLLNGQMVSEVSTIITPKETTQTAFFEDFEGGRLSRSMRIEEKKFLRHSGMKTNLGLLYPCTVAAQSEDLLSVDLIPDDEDIAGEGLQNVPIRYGVPGVKAKFTIGARCSLGFDYSDPSRPYAAITGFGGISSLEVAPSPGTDLNITSTGTGSVNVNSSTDVNINSTGSVVLNNGSSPVARVGDSVRVVLPQANAAGAPVVYVADANGIPGVITAEIIKGSSKVLA